MSWFGDKFESDAVPLLRRHLGDSAVYTDVTDGTTYTVTVNYTEFVGAVDEKQRAIHYMDKSRPYGMALVDRGDYITLDGVRWIIIDIRDDLVGNWELRCDSPEEIA